MPRRLHPDPPDRVAVRPSLEEFLVGARLLSRLPGFARRSIGSAEALRELNRRRARRETDFLGLLRSAVYDHSGSPYLSLLQHAGCEYGDLEGLVRDEGIEGALRLLAARGVYLTVEELKGRRPIVRGSTTIVMSPSALRRPGGVFQVPVGSAGSRGAGSQLFHDLAFLRAQGVNRRLVLDARGGSGWVPAYWGVPGGSALGHILIAAAAGVAPVRWFSQLPDAAAGLHPRYRWSTRVIRWGSRVCGLRLPRPEHVPLDDPLVIARWMHTVLARGAVPHLHTFASSAVHLCRAATDAGLRLDGVQFTLGSEPTTAARLAVIRKSGAEAVPNYGSAECGFIAYGCLRPTTPSDLHLLDDLHAVIQQDSGPGDDTGGLGPLLVSSLHPAASLVLLNVSLGDHALLDRRACGCPLERLGWRTHLSMLRSHEKLTVGGMAFADADVVHVLEEQLPGRFGGCPSDYQLVEDEARDGRPRLRLLVHPSVGPVDPRAVADALLAGLGTGSGAERIMALAWREGDVLRVERRAPYVTPSGKILHVHLRRAPALVEETAADGVS
jgi:hypothetical protein